MVYLNKRMKKHLSRWKSINFYMKTSMKTLQSHSKRIDFQVDMWIYFSINIMHTLFYSLQKHNVDKWFVCLVIITSNILLKNKTRTFYDLIMSCKLNENGFVFAWIMHFLLLFKSIFCNNNNSCFLLGKCVFTGLQATEKNHLPARSM